MKKVIPYIVFSVMLVACSFANIVELGFSGNYDTHGNSIFGESGSAVPYFYTLTFDTALNSDTQFFQAGEVLGESTTVTEWHAYSKSSIISSSLNFGSMNWTAADIVPRIPAAGVSADIWFDTDIGITVPTRSWIFFEAFSFATGSKVLELGGGYGTGINIFLDDRSSLFASSANALSTSMNIASIPEPSTTALWFSAITCFVVLFKIRRGKRIYNEG